MAGFPLMALGAGLGIAADDINKQRMQQAQLQMQQMKYAAELAQLRMALQQQQQKQNLAALDLSPPDLTGGGGDAQGAGPAYPAQPGENNSPYASGRSIGGATDPASLVKRYESQGNYNVGFGGTDLSNAPHDQYGFPQWPGAMGPKGISHAAGAYQIQPGTWGPAAAKLGIHDFSPASQDAVFNEVSHGGRDLSAWAPYNQALAGALNRPMPSPPRAFAQATTSAVTPGQVVTDAAGSYRIPDTFGSEAADRAIFGGQGAAQPSATGMVEPGNIDLNRRPIVNNADGSYSTVRSMSFEENGQEVLIPTVAADGSRILSDGEAIDQYHRTGQHLGKFADPQAADAYAQQLHQQQAQQYGRQAQGQQSDATPPLRVQIPYPNAHPLTVGELGQLRQEAVRRSGGDQQGANVLYSAWVKQLNETRKEQMDQNRFALSQATAERQAAAMETRGEGEPKYGTFVDAQGKKQEGEVYWDKQRRSHVATDTGEVVKQFKPTKPEEALAPDIEVPEKWAGMPSKPPPGISAQVWTWALASARSGGEIKPPLPWGKSPLRDQFNQAIPAAQYALGIDPQEMDQQRIKFIGEQARERSIMQAFGGGMLGRNMVSLNTVADHLNLLRQYALALQNHDTQLQNQIVNRMSTQMGWPETIQFALAGTIAGDEVVRLLTTTGGTREDREGIARLLSPYNSPDQLTSAIDTAANFVRSRYDPLKQQFSQGQPDKEQYFVNNMLTPEARDLYMAGPPATIRSGPAPSSGGPNAPPQQGAPGGAGVTITNPQTGEKMRLEGGKWVPMAATPGAM